MTADSEEKLGPMRAAFSFLEREHGFRSINERFDPEFFGNALLQFSAEQLTIQVDCDRDQYFCSFSSATDPQVSFSECTILQALEANVDCQSLIQSKWASVYDLATIVKRHLPRIATMFAVGTYPTTRSTLMAIRRGHLRERIGFEPN